MRMWAMAAGLGFLLAGCTSPYQAALDSPPPTPGPGGTTAARDQQALAPYQTAAIQPTQPAPTDKK